MRVNVFLVSRSQLGSPSTKVDSLFCLRFVVGDGSVYEFSIFAASREMVVHGTHHVFRFRGRMGLGVPMLCNVEYQQFSQAEGVAKLVF